MDIIERLCKQFTDLTDEEIGIIKGMSAVLQPLANLEDADIFVDCPAADGDAIVVAEAKPQSVPSSYKKTGGRPAGQAGKRTRRGAHL